MLIVSRLMYVAVLLALAIFPIHSVKISPVASKVPSIVLASGDSKAVMPEPTKTQATLQSLQ